jgi:hypothetical protein
MTRTTVRTAIGTGITFLFLLVVLSGIILLENYLENFKSH